MFRAGAIIIILFQCFSAVSAIGIIGESSRLVFVHNQHRLFAIDTASVFMELLQVKQLVDLKLGSFKTGKEKIKHRSQNAAITKTEKQVSGIIVSGLIDNTFNFKMILSEDHYGNVSISITLDTAAVYNKIKFHIQSDKHEQIFGGGEQFSYYNLKGEKIPLTVEENGIGRGDRGISFITGFINADGTKFRTYAPVPFFITSANRGLFLQSEDIAMFDFEKENEIVIEVNGNSIELMLFYGASPLDIIEKYTRITGRMKSLPRWVYSGSILGLQGGKNRVNEILKSTIEAGNPVKAIWIQDWAGKKQTRFGSRLNWNWEISEQDYPEAHQWIDSLQQYGIRVLAYINPFLLKDAPMFSVASSKQYLVKNQDGSDYVFPAGGFDAGLIDLFNEEARMWYKSVIQKNMVDIGLSGWMADFGEWYPLNRKNENEFFGNELHNKYATEWIKLNSELVKENSDKQLFFFNRSGYSYVNSYSQSFWLGDQMTGYGRHDGLPSAICGMISGSVSGILVNHWDIGGYTSFKKGPFSILRKEELMKRWTEISPFIPVFRTHEGLTPEKNIQTYSSDIMQQFFARFAKEHEKLVEYISELLMLAEAKGYPVNRPLFLNFPNDKNTYHIQTQFMLGNKFLVAPVLKKKAEKVKVYFPEGKWKHYYTGEIVAGPVSREIAAPIGQPAVFELINN
jgi:sulfoquinovosidase